MKKLTLSLAALLVIPTALFAAPKKSGTVVFDHAVVVGTVTLPAGSYKVTWTDPGPGSKVTFSQDKKTPVVVPATVVPKNNPKPSVETRTEGSTTLLDTLEFKTVSLSFAATAASGR